MTFYKFLGELREILIGSKNNLDAFKSISTFVQFIYKEYTTNK